jgi:cytochrome d ubiquinol oxidase subunit I
MSDLLAGRLQMAFSLGFHIIFAGISMVMPFFMTIAYYRWLKSGSEIYEKLAKSWARGVAILFAVGAVSGTMLSFELGLLWPGFMRHAGPVIGMPFSLEGAFFFVESIAIGLFIYGWKVMPRWAHFSSGVIVGISGLMSGTLVIAANGWMNAPAGFDWINGKAENIDPVAAMFNRAWGLQALHMVLAAFVATGFMVSGIHAALLLRKPGHALHLAAIKITLPFATIAALLQPISGDLSAKDVAKRQPAKLAAMEAHYKTAKSASLTLGGIPDDETGEVKYGIEIPYLLSFLAHGDFNAEVTGLDKIPTDERPPVLVTHIAFEVMVGLGSLLMLIAVTYWYFRWRNPNGILRRWFLKILTYATPLGFIALEAGWVVTEVGRQPWIIQGIMKTKDALTPMPGLVYTFIITTLIYVILAILVAWLMGRQIKSLDMTAAITAEKTAIHPVDEKGISPIPTMQL